MCNNTLHNTNNKNINILPPEIKKINKIFKNNNIITLLHESFADENRSDD